MGNGPTKAKIAPGRTISFAPDTYLIAKRMESVGMLRPGQALMLAATLPKSTKNGATKRGKK